MPIIFVVFALVVIAIAAGSYFLKQRRIDALGQTAARLGLRFSSDDAWGIDERYPFQLFDLGDGRGCENVMTGTWNGFPVTEFDYWYYTTSTDGQGHRSRSYHRFTCAITTIDASCPHLTLGAESVFTRLASHLSFHDIEFESEEFNKAWQVKAADRKFANDLVDQRMMKWLLWSGTDWSWEVYDNSVMCFTGKQPPEGIENLLQCLKGFREHIPHVVASLYPARSSGR